MSQIILVEPHSTRNALFSINLYTYLGADVIPKKNVAEVIELLGSHTEIDLIISPATMENGEKTAFSINKHLKSNRLSIPMMVLGQEPLLAKYATQLDPNCELKEFIRTVAGILNITPKQMADKKVEDFYPIPIFYFLVLGELPCDVFIKVKSHDSQGAQDDSQGAQDDSNSFAKKFLKGKKIDLVELQGAIKSGVKILYVPKEFRLKLTNEVSSGLTQKLKNAKTFEEKVDYTDQSMELLREQVNTVGFTREVIDLSMSALDSIRGLVNESPNIKILLERILSRKTSYQYRHCQLITFISFVAMDNLKWGGQEQLKLIAFVSMFHDICLTKDEMVMINDDEGVLKSTLMDSEKEIVRRHAMEATLLIKQFPKAPMSAEMLIKQHHGSLSGIGFPKVFSNNISPLAIVFIISEEITHFILARYHHKDSPVQKSLQDFIFELKKKYIKNMYHKVLGALQNLNF